jgi:hypothetical protein
VLAAVTTIFAPSAILYGAPLTFQFNATVIDAAAGNPFALPFSYQVGDVITGRLTFEPGIGTPISHNAIRADQILPIEFVVEDFTFGSTAYTVEVFNDDTIEDADPPLSGLVDTMKIVCSPSATEPCTPQHVMIPGFDAFSIGVRFELKGDDSIFHFAHVSGDSSIWNSFELQRLLTVGFANDSGGIMSLAATVGQFIQVPEPSGFVATLLLLLAAAASYRTR